MLCSVLSYELSLFVVIYVYISLLNDNKKLMQVSWLLNGGYNFKSAVPNWSDVGFSSSGKFQLPCSSWSQTFKQDINDFLSEYNE